MITHHSPSWKMAGHNVIGHRKKWTDVCNSGRENVISVLMTWTSLTESEQNSKDDCFPAIQCRRCFSGSQLSSRPHWSVKRESAMHICSHQLICIKHKKQARSMKVGLCVRCSPPFLVLGVWGERQESTSAFTSIAPSWWTFRLVRQTMFSLPCKMDSWCEK